MENGTFNKIPTEQNPIRHDEAVTTKLLLAVDLSLLFNQFNQVL